MSWVSLGDVVFCFFFFQAEDGIRDYDVTGVQTCALPILRSRIHPKYKTKYRVNNWAEYDRSLVQRGDITLWISEDAIVSWKPAPTGRRGAQWKFSDSAIETALTLRLVFNLPLRQAEGLLRSILSLMSIDLEAPDHTTLSRRSQSLSEPQCRSASCRGRREDRC